MTNDETENSSRGCGYVGNWEVCCYPHIHSLILPLVTFLLNSKG
jgi:hypothetical protein